MERIAHTLGTALLIATAACTGTVEDAVTADARGFSVSEHTATTIAGSVANEHGAVEFAAATTGAGLVWVDIAINGKHFGLRAEPSDQIGWLAIEGDLTVDADDVALIDALADSAVDYLGTDTYVYQERALIGAAQYLAQLRVADSVAPVVRDVYQVDAPVPASTANNGITCIRKGSSYTASYDRANGAVRSRSITCNSNWGSSVCGSGNYACMGRCGAGCSGISWTLDCLEHDYCSHDECASGGSSDNNCGDEYNHAIEDAAAFWCWG